MSNIFQGKSRQDFPMSVWVQASHLKFILQSHLASYLELNFFLLYNLKVDIHRYI